MIGRLAMKTLPCDYWQIDATVIRLTTGIRIYLQTVIDNFSRRILAWRVSDMLSSPTTRELLIEASKRLPGIGPIDRRPAMYRTDPFIGLSARRLGR